MNKLILREAIKYGFSISYNSIKFQNHSIDLNNFLVEANKLQFTNSLHNTLKLLKNNLFKIEKHASEFENEQI